MTDIERIGFFHFAEGHGDPIGRLKKSLAEQPPEDLPGSLIVLPEVFNLGRFYHPLVASERVAIVGSPERVRDMLVELSLSAKVAFVAGLLETPETGGTPYNSAFLILPEPGAMPILLSRKREAGPPFYQPFDGSAGVRVYEFGGVCIASLVCNDYQRFGVDLAHVWGTGPRPRKVLCIPACIGNTFSGKTVDSFAGAYAVVANSRHDEYGSLIVNTTGRVRCRFGEHQQFPLVNKVYLRTWAELD